MFDLFGKKKPTPKSGAKKAKPDKPLGKLMDESGNWSGQAAQSEDAGAIQKELPPILADLKLVLSDSLDEAQTQRVNQLCERLPEPHPIQSSLASGLETSDDLLAALAKDAGLTAGVLKVVNSPAFAVSAPISSVQHAVNYLGVPFTRGLVAQVAMADQTQDCSAEQQAAIAKIWRSASLASAFANMLGQQISHERPSVLGTKALFFNLGDFALVTGWADASAWYHTDTSLADRVIAQQSSSGVNSAVVGSALAKHWGLSDEIVEAISLGLVPLTHPPAQLDFDSDAHKDAVLLYLASRIGDRVTYRGTRDIAELDLVASEEPGLFYLAEQLKAAGHGRVISLLEDAGFRRKVNRLFATLGD